MGPYFNKAHNLGLTLHRIDETLSTINKPKHPKEGENKDQNGRTHVQDDK
jgi:hypothetical protein